MLIYADHSVQAEATATRRALLRTLRTLAAQAAPEHDDLVAALVDAGIFESAVADLLCDQRDEATPVLSALRDVSEALGLATAASWLAVPGGDRALGAAIDALERIHPDMLPPRVELRTPEGYAFYALYPEAFVDAALEWARARAPARIVCLGLRSIGTSLSAVVHGAFVLAGFETHSWTLRPRGHVFDRHIDVSADLAARWTTAGTTFVVVDEGPGLSGSSLTGTAAWLTSIGIPRDRIVMLAAWNPDVSRLRSERARRVWPAHTVITGDFERVRRRVIEASGIAPDATDISAGRWRAHFTRGQHWPPSQPQHERMKLLTPDGRIARFAGLGPYGRLAHAHAGRLASERWTAPPVALSRGFLSLPCIDGVPMTAEAADEAFVRHAAGYIAWLRREESTDGTASTGALESMLVVNVREGLGEAALAAAERLIEAARAFAEPAVRVDGRLLPHEWLRTADGFAKTDALDHHRDHFLPGASDAAWDVAGLIVEFRLPGGAQERLLSAYSHASGDRAIGRRLPFYMASYAAFRMGYCAMAESSVDAEERQRFTHAREQYAMALRAALAQLPTPNR